MAVLWREDQIPAVDWTQSRRKRWTREELSYLEKQDFFAAGAYELLDGELFSKMGKHPPHTFALLSLLKFLRSVFGEDYPCHESVIDLAPADNPTSEPEPDIIVLREPFVAFARRYPAPADIRLLVEVADTSLALDLRIKRDLYARAGIAEYWVVDLNGRRLIVHRNPIEGQYAQALALSENESIAPLAAPEHPLLIASILPPLI